MENKPKIDCRVMDVPQGKKPLGLYLHIPFCLKKCAYCDFPSFAGRESQMEAYKEAVLAELAFWKERTGKYRVDSIFVGGGTPTALPQSLLCEILESVQQTFSLDDACEWTVECNPGTAQLPYFQALKACGVNRISLGVQSLDETELQTLGRIHTSEDVELAVQALQSAGFSNWSLDLMYGFFGQRPDTFYKTLSRAVALQPSHLSAYSLIIEEGTPFASRDRSDLPSEEEELQMDLIKEQILADYGFQRYEISNYAKPGKECRHNLKYWHMDAYLGVGSSAHSYFGGKRFYHAPDLNRYLENPLEFLEEESMSRRDEMGEYMMLGLRTLEGVSLDRFHQRFSADLLEVYRDTIARHEKNGLLRCVNGRLFLTPRGLEVSNYVMCDFI